MKVPIILYVGSMLVAIIGIAVFAANAFFAWGKMSPAPIVAAAIGILVAKIWMSRVRKGVTNG